MSEQTYYVVIPFTSRESAEYAARRVLHELGFSSELTSGTEDDPPQLPGVPFTCAPGEGEKRCSRH